MQRNIPYVRQYDQHGNHFNPISKYPVVNRFPNRQSRRASLRTDNRKVKHPSAYAAFCTKIKSLIEDGSVTVAEKKNVWGTRLRIS
jgi:hypothetical protein